MGLNSKANKKETEVFPPNSKHIQQKPNLKKTTGRGKDSLFSEDYSGFYRYQFSST